MYLSRQFTPPPPFASGAPEIDRCRPDKRTQGRVQRLGAKERRSGDSRDMSPPPVQVEPPRFLEKGKQRRRASDSSAEEAAAAASATAAAGLDERRPQEQLWSRPGRKERGGGAGGAGTARRGGGGAGRRDRIGPAKMRALLPLALAAAACCAPRGPSLVIPGVSADLRPQTDLTSNCFNFPEQNFDRESSIVAVNGGNTPYLPLETGGDAIDFTLHDLAGEPWSLRQALEETGLPVVMVFGMWTCPAFQGYGTYPPWNSSAYWDERDLVSTRNTERVGGAMPSEIDAAV